MLFLDDRTRMASYTSSETTHSHASDGEGCEASERRPRNSLPCAVAHRHHSAQRARFSINYGRGQYMITPTPIKQMTAPMASGMSGRFPSADHPQSNEPATNTPP